MKHQTTLNEYFKLKSNSFKAMDEGRKRKLSLSLKKTPSKSPKLKVGSTNCDNVIDLVSDDDEESKKVISEFDRSQSRSSESTVIYTPETTIRSPCTSRSSIEFSTTPLSQRSSTSYLSPSAHTPTTKRKFFSPTKKRSISIKSPNKVKRNLAYSLSTSNKQNISNEYFLQATQGVDDKTVFLLKIIYQFLQDENLKPLLKESSYNLLSAAMQVKKPGMRLVCRLYWQQEGWRRWDQVKKIMTAKQQYDDPTMQEAVKSLEDSGFLSLGNISNGQQIDFVELVRMLKSEELKSICKVLKIKTTTKEDSVQLLRNYCNKKTNMTNYLTGPKITNESQVLKLLRSKIGLCYKLSSDARETLKELYALMYLGMDYNIIKEKKLELMLLNEKSHMENYPVDEDMEIDNASLVFKNRKQFVSYIDACALYDDFEAATELTKKCELIKSVYNLYNEIKAEDMMCYIRLPEWLYRFTPAYIYVKLLESGIPELKKFGENILAINILSTLIKQNTFRQHKKCEWYAEKALLLDKYSHSPDEAAEVLLEGFDDSNLSEEEKDVMRPRAKLLANRQTNVVTAPLKAKLLERAVKSDILEKNIHADHIYKIPMNNSGRGKIKFQTRTSEGLLVHEAEEYCIYHYLKEGKYTHGGHWEGKIIVTIFFLLFWDIIYAPLQYVRGIFLSRYQAFPLDMFCDSFYTNRKSLIEERLKEIEETPIDDTISKMEAVWNSRPENEVSGVHRGAGWEALRGAARALRPRRLAALARRLARRHAHARAGFPDLTLWHERTGEIAFVEVKTDFDKPSMKQIQWMHYMKRNDIDTKFCYVGADTGRAKSRNTENLEF